MKHNPGNRRPRSRGSNNSSNNNNSKRQGGGRSNFESSGPDVKVRGTAQQVYEKYAMLARDAFTSGDRMVAESYFQYAEHYHRIMSAAEANNPKVLQNSQSDTQPVLIDGATLERKNPPVAEVSMNEADELPVSGVVEEISNDQPVLAQTPVSASNRRRSRSKPQPSLLEVDVADTEPPPV
jgi:hypothetical protein